MKKARIALALAVGMIAGCPGHAVAAQTAVTATVGTAFSYQWQAAVGGYGYATNGTQNTLPSGLVYNPSTGVLSGTPTAAGTYTLTLGTGSPFAVVSTLALTVGTATPTPVPTPTPTPVPAALFCATDPNPACGVVLTWSAGAANADPNAVAGYQVYRYTGTAVPPMSSFTKIGATVTGTTYTDTTIAPSTTYAYLVVSVDSAGTQSAPSNTVTVQVAAAPSIPTPPTPMNLTGSVVN